MSVLTQGPKEAEIAPETNGPPATDGLTAEEYGILLSTLARAFRREYPEAFVQTIAPFVPNGDDAKATVPKEDPLLKFAGDWKDRPELLKAIAEARHYYNNRPLEDTETDSASI